MKRRNIFVSYGKFVIFENISRVSSFRNEEAKLKRQSSFASAAFARADTMPRLFHMAHKT